MASMSYPTFSSYSTRFDTTATTFTTKPSFTNPRFYPKLRFQRLHDVGVYRCSSSDSTSSWGSGVQETLRNVMDRIDGYLNSVKSWGKEAERSGDGLVQREIEALLEKEVDEMGWDWERWKEHFEDVDNQERIIAVLKSQLAASVSGQDYEDAARLKVAIAAASASDTVGRAMAILERAIREEEYKEAAYLRDAAGAGLVGWWNGISEDASDPYGRIIRITAEHGRYVATSYSARQLATAAPGSPVFEIFLTIDMEGDYKQQAVYLRRKVVSQDFLPLPSRFPIPSTSGSLRMLGPDGEESDPIGSNAEDTENSEDQVGDSDVADSLPGFQNFLKDMIPGVKIRVLKVTAPEKVDRDTISKVIEQIMDEEDEEEDEEDEVKEEEEDGIENGANSNLLSLDADAKLQYDLGKEDAQLMPELGLTSKMAMKFLFHDLSQKLASNVRPKDLLRVPAKLEKKGRKMFSFSIEKDDEQQSNEDEKKFLDKQLKLQGQRSIDNVMLDLATLRGKEKINVKVFKDIGEFINNSINQARNQQPLSGSTTFSRIDLPAYPDPLNGLYVGSNGLYSSEVIQLRRKFGQFQEGKNVKDPSNLEFYEYVEALKLTGDPHVPAGQVAFRAKVGKRYQLPHKGVIPEEFGVVARYKGQGRLAEPGFKNPRWVDGELVILDGKFIKGGHAVGFVYWAPEYHFILFYSSLRLED